MPQPIDPQDWDQIDEYLFSRDVFSALKHIRQAAQCDLKTAIDIVHQRFGELATEYPEHFRCKLETYWNGFYS